MKFQLVTLGKTSGVLRKVLHDGHTDSGQGNRSDHPRRIRVLARCCVVPAETSWVPVPGSASRHRSLVPVTSPLLSGLLLPLIFVQQPGQCIFVAGGFCGYSAIVQFQASLFRRPFLQGAYRKLSAKLLYFTTMTSTKACGWNRLDSFRFDRFFADNTESHFASPFRRRVKKAGPRVPHTLPTAL